MDERGKFEREIACVDKYFGQFRATNLWNQIIEYLRKNANIGRQRHLFWQYENVFCGENAVDIVFKFLKHNQREFPNEVTRQNAVKVCQCLKEYEVFVAANKNQQLQRFEDSSSHLYRFKEQNKAGESYKPILSQPDASDLDKENIRMRLQVTSEDVAAYHNPNYNSDSPTSSIYYPNIQQKFPYKKRSASLDPGSSFRPTKDEILSPSLSLNSLKCKSNSSSFSRHRGVRGHRHTCLAGDKRGNVPVSQQLQRKTSLFYGRSIRKTFATSDQRNSRTLLYNNAAVAHTVTEQDSDIRDMPDSLPLSEEDRQSLLSHLLYLVNIPVLESILSVPEDLLPLTPVGDTITLGSQNDLFPRSDRIPWLDAATACMNNKAPVGMSGLWSGQSCKLHCYKSVLQYYRRLSSCLLPHGYFQLYSSVVELFVHRKPRRARNVLRLAFRVLPERRARQVEALVRFLKMASEDIFVTLDKKLGNREVVLQDFVDLMLLHPLLSKERRTSFLDFFLAHSAYVFKHPALLLTQPPVIYCRRMSCEAADSQKTASTNRALSELLSTINSTSRFSTKEKKSWLKRFHKLHSQII